MSVRLSSYDPATGRSKSISNGLLTASHRAVDDTKSRFMNGLRIQPWHPFTKEAVLPVQPGAPMLLPVEIFSTAAVIPKGHQLQVSINSSNLPQGLQPVPQLLGGLVGGISILNSDQHRSKIVLPVVPTSARFSEGIPDLIQTINEVATGKIICKPHQIKNVPENIENAVPQRPDGVGWASAA